MNDADYFLTTLFLYLFCFFTHACRDAKLGKIGAIMCYKRDFALNGAVAYEKRIFALSFDKKEYEPLVNLFPVRKDTKS